VLFPRLVTETMRRGQGSLPDYSFWRTLLRSMSHRKLLDQSQRESTSNEITEPGKNSGDRPELGICWIATSVAWSRGDSSK